MNLPIEAYQLKSLRTYELFKLASNLTAFQYFTESVDSGLNSIKIGCGQLQIDKSDRDALFLEQVHELGSVKGIRLAKFDIPEQHAVSPGIFYPLR